MNNDEKTYKGCFWSFVGFILAMAAILLSACSPRVIEKIEKQTARLSRIAEEAAKQCGRSRLTTVTPPISFTEALAAAKCADLALFCYEGDGTVSLKSALTGAEEKKTLAVIVGCEGGFSEKEADEARAAGLTPVNLGPRILRCETAPAYVLSVISYFFEL
jgi:16S rRNA (uracil1498-N3)-methyltransferase